MPTRVALVDGVGNVVVYEITNKALPVVVNAASCAFVRTGETVRDLPVYRLRNGGHPTIREATVDRYTAEAA